MRKTSGQSLTEYGLIVSLVVLSAITALSLLGGNTMMTLSNLVGTASASEPLGTAKLTEPPGSSPVPSAQSPASPATGTAISPPAFTTANGTDIQLANYPIDLHQSVATSGANGTTSLLANNLTSTAQQLLDAGDISQTQFNELMDLANQGHKLATIYGLLEQAHEADMAGKTSMGYENYELMYNGQMTPVWELQGMVGWFNTDPGTGFVVNDPLNQTMGVSGSDTERFRSLYQSLEQSGALSDPAIMAAVSDMSSQIVMAGKAVQDWEDILGSQASYGQQTNGNSAGICTTGGSSDTGTHCSNP